MSFISNSMEFQIMPCQPFLSALDYIFYLELHIERAKNDFSDEEESLQSFRDFNKDIPKLNELLKKLGLDLKSAFDPFVIEFVDSDGVYSLLNLLRLCLNRQQMPTNIRDSDKNDKHLKGKERHLQLRSALNDEYECLVCLQFAVKRNSRASQKMISHKTGLSSLAACIVSNSTKSRLIALQLLSKACDQTEGVNKVLEAMSTMRIIFAESVRFKFLVSMVNSGQQLYTCSPNSIECSALSLINTLLNKTGNYAERIRLQCELEEAGLDLNFLEKVLIENNVPKDEMIWTEIHRFRKQYIDLNEKYAKKLQSIDKKTDLKEEVEILQRALNKLEEDKINLMTIERELKEKCEDLEQEVDHLKTKFNVLIPGIDSQTDPLISEDKPQDLKINFISNKNKLQKNLRNVTKTITKNDFNFDHNLRNEEEFIYVPAIHPPPNFTLIEDRERQTNEFKSDLYSYNSNPIFQNIDNENDMREEDRESTPNQSHRRKLHKERGVSNKTDKPLVIDVHPKQFKETFVGKDRENYETILRWNYSNQSKQETDLTEKYINSKKISNSMNQINAIKDNFIYKNETQNQFNQSVDNFSFESNSRKSLSQSNDCLYSKTNNKKKNIRSSLQSYFFSGCSTLKQNKKYFNNFENTGDSQKSFPLPKTYRKNFILKGHGNCGLYSGDLKETSAEKNLSDDLKSDPNFDKISALVHKEIAEATKHISSWI